MGLYEDVREIADGVLQQFKQGEMTLIRSTEGARDPDRPGQPGELTEVEYILAGAAKGNPDEKYLENSNITMSDAQITCSAYGFVEGVRTLIDPAPSTADKVDIDGTVHAIKEVFKIPSAGPAVVFKIICAK